MVSSLSSCLTFKQSVFRCEADLEVRNDGDPWGVALAVGHKVYFAKASNRSIALFNVHTNSWHLLFTEPGEDRFDIQMNWLNKDRLFVFGPHPGRDLGCFRYFDLILHEWVSWEPTGEDLGPRWCVDGVLHEPTMQYITFGGSISNVRDNQLFVVSHEKNLVYKPKTSGRSPSFRSRHSMCISGDSVFVYGGRQLELLNDLYCLDVRRNVFVWSEIKLKEGAPLRDFHAVAHVHGRIFIYGGGLPSGGYSDSVCFIELRTKEAVDIDNNEKGIVCNSVTGQPKRPASYRPVVVLLGNDMLLFGENPEIYAKLSPDG